MRVTLPTDADFGDRVIIVSLSGTLSAVEDLVWRSFYRSVFPAAKLWWLLTKARHQGALVATYVGPDLLLLRSSYRRAWNFPGGGVHPGETPEQAARREIQEETGLQVPVLQPRGSAEGFWECRQERVHFFELRLQQMPPIRIDRREIVEARLFPPDALAGMQLTGPVTAFLHGERQAALPPAIGEATARHTST